MPHLAVLGQQRRHPRGLGAHLLRLPRLREGRGDPGRGDHPAAEGHQDVRCDVWDFATTARGLTGRGGAGRTPRQVAPPHPPLRGDLSPAGRGGGGWPPRQLSGSGGCGVAAPPPPLPAGERSPPALRRRRVRGSHANGHPPALPFRLALAALLLSVPAPAADPVLVGHRGLPTHAPEETLAGFNACVDLRVGIELDVRRTRDGQLVCLHDPTVDRTTDGKGKLADLSLRELRRLDAGRRFDPAFAGERVPALEELFSLLKERKATSTLVAVDLKEPDCEADAVKLAEKAGVLKQVVFIGLAIENVKVREKLKEANPAAACAALCPAADGLGDALADTTADWVYVRFIPTADEVKKVHAAGKRVFLVGPLVMGKEPGNWAKARAAGVDAVLTDFPLECRAGWRPDGKK
ncbi:MAG: hypothetical protein C0501_12950 [Isosphaera sp.]|nr:hypothetical protein [Isosphaera sp.]